MTEEEAVSRLCELLNEIRAAGHCPSADRDGDGIWVGDRILRQAYTAAGGWGDWGSGRD